jgi:hypothetical protein
MRVSPRRPVPHLAHGLLTLATLAAPLAAQDIGWPREIRAPNVTITIYQLQPERFQNNVLTGRAAISLTRPGKTEPVFGVFWFTSRLDTDLDSRTAVVRDIKLDRIKWPDATPAQEREYARLVEGSFPPTGIPMSLDRLSASLATAKREQRSLEGLRHDPPKIIFSQTLAELLLYDGEPRTMPIEGSSLEQVVNSPFAVIKDRMSGLYYLAGGKLWYSASDPMGPWSPIQKPPPYIESLVPPDTSSVPAPPRPPGIVVATAPTELVVTDGPPRWKPIGKGELLYVENTETPWLRELSSQQVYILLSGRWFRSPGVQGPWTFVRPDQLPASFRDIPPESPLGAVRESVAGTDEAEDAALDAQIPQTAAIKRSEARLEVRYDGEPQFTRIAGTAVEYAINTAAQVLRIGGRYYACDNGVWFVADNATGPWIVADSIPDEAIQQIPPSAPVYNLTDATILESTPDVVYVGYTPGYLWSFIYYGVPVYGTGWYYPPYWGQRYYFPRPCTWGFHVGYNPWLGWTFGHTWGWGFLGAGFGFRGWYGGYYHPGRPLPGWHAGWLPPGYHYRPRPAPQGPINVGDRYGSRSRVRLGSPGENNLYRRGENRARIADHAMPQRIVPPIIADQRARGKPNDVFADRDGRIQRRTPQGWETRDGWLWKRVPQTAGPPGGVRQAPPTGAKGPPQTARPAPRDIDREFRARARGADRAARVPPRVPAPPPRSRPR